MSFGLLTKFRSFSADLSCSDELNEREPMFMGKSSAASGWNRKAQFARRNSLQGRSNKYDQARTTQALKSAAEAGVLYHPSRKYIFWKMA
jgi:hypothetical protein